MPISIRLDTELEQAMRHYLSRHQVAKSEFIREAIREKLDREAGAAGPYQLGHEVFGRYASGRDDRSVNRKALLKERLRERHRR
jgi:predicted DNA-binding protein